MTRPEAVAAVVERLIRELMPTLEREEIAPSTTFQDLGMDSLKLIDLLGAAEGHFDIEVPDEDLGGFVRVNDLTEYVVRLG